MTRLIDPQARAELEAAIDARIATGVKAAAYHTDDEAMPSSTLAEGTSVERTAGVGRHLVGCTDDDCVCPPSKPDRVSEQACNDHARMRAAIAILLDIQARYEPAHRGKTPGVGPCPPGKCVDCWAASYEVAAARKRYAVLCRRHGDWRKRNSGKPMSVLLTRALKETDGDWSSWQVRRAQRSA